MSVSLAPGVKEHGISSVMSKCTCMRINVDVFTCSSGWLAAMQAELLSQLEGFKV